MKNLKRELKITDDGSHTLFVPELNEHYHSTHGAIQEALHIYLNAGFCFVEKNPVHILEIGFGTGLNCFLTYLEAQKQNRSVVYHSIELYPINQEQIESLNYATQIESDQSNIFEQLHRAEWDQAVQISPNFSLYKLNGNLLNYPLPGKYDLVYFDAFAPEVQPELWTQEVFEKIYQHTNPEGILTTYSTKGIVKRALRASGFEVKRLPGPPGKREMLRAKRMDNFFNP